uniref:Ribosomal RNA-processing protein 42 n=1 Tax=Gopherus agassizii TaxID=38772 RepID=A0A452GTK2_9SAUR
MQTNETSLVSFRRVLVTASPGGGRSSVWNGARAMASVVLSEAEKVYIVHGIQADLRVDGRGCEDYRCIEVETDVVSNTSGSARVKLGHTDILVGVKAEMGTPKLENPNEGYLEFFVDWIPKVRVLEDEEGSKEIELSDDPYDCIRLNVENVPCIITLSKTGKRVGKKLHTSLQKILDKEESLGTTRQKVGFLG